MKPSKDHSVNRSPGAKALRAPSIPGAAFLALLAAAALPGCVSVDLPIIEADPGTHVGTLPPPPPDGGYALNRPYDLVPGDVIDITVREQPDLSIVITIPSDGIIEVFRSEKDGGEREKIDTRGKTVEEIRDEIAAIYQRVRFSFKPYVQVTLATAASRVVYVRGAVRTKDGKVDLPPGSRMTLYRAIQAAGGIDPEEADLSRVTIDRKDPATGAKVSLPEYDLELMQETAAFDRDPPLEPNDTINIPALGEVTVFGNINQPGKYKCRRKLTMLGLLALAGGPKPFSKLSDVRVTRAEGTGRERTYRVDVFAILDGRAVDPLMAARDRVWIDETWK